MTSFNLKCEANLSNSRGARPYYFIFVANFLKHAI